MEDIYPGLTLGGFIVEGEARTRPKPNFNAGRIAGRIGVDVPDWLGGLYVANLHAWRRPDETFVAQADPQFHFKALTPKFFADTIGDRESFTFSLAGGEIGEAIHVSGAAARDYFGNVTQPIAAVRAQGSLTAEGLTLTLEGELGEGTLQVPEAAQEMQTSYAIRLRLPWETLRFVFYSRRLWLVVHHGRLHNAAAGR